MFTSNVNNYTVNNHVFLDVWFALFHQERYILLPSAHLTASEEKGELKTVRNIPEQKLL